MSPVIPQIYTEPLICFLISNTSGFANISPDFSPVSIRIRFTKIFLKFVYKVRDIIDLVNSQFWVYRKWQALGCYFFCISEGGICLWRLINSLLMDRDWIIYRRTHTIFMQVRLQFIPIIVENRVLMKNMVTRIANGREGHTWVFNLRIILSCNILS